MKRGAQRYRGIVRDRWDFMHIVRSWTIRGSNCSAWESSVGCKSSVHHCDGRELADHTPEPSGFVPVHPK
jgi:hypothetical protein